MLNDASVNNPPESPLLISNRTVLEISDFEFSQIRNILLNNCGFNLDAYKDRCIKRRIAMRTRANHCDTVRDYCDLLQVSKTELDHLLKVLTIHVSQFFRNFSTFEKLRLEIIPLLFDQARRSGKKELKFWSLGCATGEEPYTLALILAEHFSQEMLEIPVVIEATDVDAATVAQAKNGRFLQERLVELPLNYLQKYFNESSDLYQLVPEITSMVKFTLGDMFNNSLYRHCDLILCRNVMIYFSREQQEKIFRNIARILDKNGFLVLGKSETLLGNNRNHFQTVCPLERIYRPTPINP